MPSGCLHDGQISEDNTYFAVHSFTNHILARTRGDSFALCFPSPTNTSLVSKFVFVYNFFIWQVSLFDKRNEIKITLDKPVGLC